MWPMAIGHRQHRQSECQGHAHQANAQVDRRGAYCREELGGQHGASAAAEDEPEGSKEFRNEFLLHGRVFLSWFEG